MERYDGSQSDRILPATNGVIQAIQAVSQKDTILLLTNDHGVMKKHNTEYVISMYNFVHIPRTDYTTDCPPFHHIMQ